MYSTGTDSTDGSCFWTNSDSTDTPALVISSTGTATTARSPKAEEYDWDDEELLDLDVREPINPTVIARASREPSPLQRPRRFRTRRSRPRAGGIGTRNFRRAA